MKSIHVYINGQMVASFFRPNQDEASVVRGAILNCAKCKTDWTCNLVEDARDIESFVFFTSDVLRSGTLRVEIK